MVDFAYLFTTLLSYYLPMPDGMMKMQMAMALGQLLGQICEPIKKWIVDLNIWAMLFSTMMKNHITIENNHPLYDNIINYLYNKFINEIKGANMNHQEGKKKMLIEVLQISSLVDGDIEISFGELPSSDETKKETTRALGKKIIFSSKKSLKVIEEYVSEIIKECCRKQNNTITTYSLDIEKSDKNRSVRWKIKVSTSNKTMKNTIVRQSVKENFYDDLTRFMETEDIYKTRGISYKRGYLLHGIPGSGKSSMVAAIANEYGFPVFKLDLSILESNEELTKAENTIYDYIGPFDPHIVLVEDFDRSKVMDCDYDGNSKSKITMDCILNVLDGIEQTYGRIVIVTANDIRQIERNNALIRPGRIDRMIEIDYCDKQQISEILKLYFDKDVDINDDVQLTPASLNKIIQVMIKYDDIVKFINRFKYFNSGTEIEKLAVEFKENPDIEEDKVDEIKEEAKEFSDRGVRKSRRELRRLKVIKEKLPWGGKQYEKYLREISRLQSGDIKFQDVYNSNWRDKHKINGKVKQGDSLNLVSIKIDNAKQQSIVKIKELEEKKDKLVEKMRSRGTWEEYNLIKFKREHEVLWKKVMLEYKKTWEWYGGSLCRVGFRMAVKAQNRLRNYRDLSKQEDYASDSLPSCYFYTGFTVEKKENKNEDQNVELNYDSNK